MVSTGSKKQRKIGLISQLDQNLNDFIIVIIIQEDIVENGTNLANNTTSPPMSIFGLSMVKTVKTAFTSS